MSEDPESVSAAVPEASGVTPTGFCTRARATRRARRTWCSPPGRDLTPETLEWARRKLADEGRSALDRQLP